MCWQAQKGKKRKKKWRKGIYISGFMLGPSFFALFRHFNSSLGVNKQVSSSNLGGATDRSALMISSPNLLATKAGFLWTWEHFRLREMIVTRWAFSLRLPWLTGCNKESHVCYEFRVKALRSLNFSSTLKSLLCQYLILSVKREEETQDSVLDSRIKDVETPFTTVRTKGETG